MPPFEKRLFLGQCPHCLRTTLSYDVTLDTLQCEGCGAVWDRRGKLDGNTGVQAQGLEYV
jgi:Zn-finger nucleic acid-binding protein